MLLFRISNPYFSHIKFTVFIAILLKGFLNIFLVQSLTVMDGQKERERRDKRQN